MNNMRQRGAMQWIVIVTLLIASFATAMVTIAVAHISRTDATNDLVAVTQRTDVAVADAVALLSAGEVLPATRATATTTCDEVGNRPVCSAYWALPRPGNATEPVRYDLITNSWVDNDRDQLPPSDANRVRAVRVPLEAVTYQTRDGLGPKSEAGKIRYNATPPGPFGNALFGFTSTQINGPSVTVSSYNSTSGDLGTGNGVVASGGFVSYGTGTDADSTILYGSAGAGGVSTTRCTGDTCDESDVTVLTHSYSPATEASVAWMDSATCTAVVEGNWVASERGARIDTPTLCVKGSLIIDVPTRVTIPTVALYVHGSIELAASLNAPTINQLGNPAKLFVYSAGQAVTITPTETANPGTAVAAMLYAPRAACSTDPANAKAGGSYAGQMNWYGSLVCDTVSLGGSWRHLYDDAGTVRYADPVPGAAKAWTTGTYDVIDTGDSWDIPSGWETGTCVLPAPVDAISYWRLNEPSGLVALDSAGDSDLEWTTTDRGEGLCGKAAKLRSGGAAVSDQALRSATQGVTLEWWGSGDPQSYNTAQTVQAAGVRAVMNSIGHVVVEAGGTQSRVPFTIQNRDKPHLYQVTVTNDGAVTLYVDSIAKGTAKVGSPTAGGPTVLANGNRGVLHDVVVYGRTLTQQEVNDRWANWNENVSFTPSNPGVPVTAPTNVRDNGTQVQTVRMAWDAPGGTLPPEGEFSGDLIAQVAPLTGGSFSTFATMPLGTTELAEPAPALGENRYRICVRYNGDTWCSSAIELVTLDVPGVPTVTVSEVAGDSARFSWGATTDAATYAYQYRVDGGAWSSTTSNAAALSRVVTVSSGAKIEFRVRGVNAAGSSDWSAVAVADLIPGTPTMSVGSITSTTARYSWTTVAGAARYETQYRVNGGGWSGVSNVGTATSQTQGPSTQGTKIESRVRAVSAAGVAGAWSNAPVGQLTITAAKVNGWDTYSSYPQMFARLKYSGGAICPPGTIPQTQKRDRPTNGNWNPWVQTWVNGTANSTVTAYTMSQVSSYAVGAQQQLNVRCFNPASGAASAATGPHGPIEMWHPVPTPSGVQIWVSDWRTLTWTGACPAGMTFRADWWVQAAFGGTGQQNVGAGSWANTGQGWGAGNASVSAWCVAPGGRTSARVGAVGYF
ncbi:fibronectin type III domain-containing protein [Cellulosimicrobium sp. Marseille-Q4280]|uniref:DUF7305 domain-containing protein n=1 Tax=Cellulosimicrobium sp. Marseille-Q4280 TaxID=2937992 RepID=UPI00203FC23D|nr:fibronectin type III domain-containing protein [Cellulosimicrobium sp. Marseille-Q4280]